MSTVLVAISTGTIEAIPYDPYAGQQAEVGYLFGRVSTSSLQETCKKIAGHSNTLREVSLRYLQKRLDRRAARWRSANQSVSEPCHVQQPRYLTHYNVTGPISRDDRPPRCGRWSAEPDRSTRYDTSASCGGDAAGDPRPFNELCSDCHDKNSEPDPCGGNAAGTPRGGSAAGNVSLLNDQCTMTDNCEISNTATPII